MPASSSLTALFPRVHTHPWKPSPRTALLALLALATAAATLVLLLQPSLAAAAVRRPTSAASRIAAALDRRPRPHSPGKPRPPLALNPAQELAAVSSFLASLPQNVLPASIDPARPIDPSLVLDFDTRGPRAAVELAALTADVWARNPVMVYTKHFSPASRELKTLLRTLQLDPEPTVFDVDLRADADVLAPLVLRLANAESLPVVLVGGRPIGPLARVRELHESGELEGLIRIAGAVPGGKKKKKGRK